MIQDTPPSPPQIDGHALLRLHLPAIIAVSTDLLVRLTDDPSPWGTATAFLAVEASMTNALAGWSGVVNDVSASLSKRERRRSLKTVSRGSSENEDGEGGAYAKSRLAPGDIIIMPTCASPLPASSKLLRRLRFAVSASLATTSS